MKIVKHLHTHGENEKKPQQFIERRKKLREQNVRKMNLIPSQSYLFTNHKRPRTIYFTFPIFSLLAVISDEHKRKKTGPGTLFRIGCHKKLTEDFF